MLQHLARWVGLTRRRSTSAPPPGLAVLARSGRTRFT